MHINASAFLESGSTFFSIGFHVGSDFIPLFGLLNKADCFTVLVLYPSVSITTNPTVVVLFDTDMFVLWSLCGDRF